MAPRPSFDPDIETTDEDETSMTRMARMAWNQGATNKRLDSIDIKLEKLDARFEVFSGNFVTQKEFSIVRNIVYGMVGFILIGFLSAVAALVYQGGS